MTNPSYLQGFLTKLAQTDEELGRQAFEEITDKVGLGDWKAKSWADLSSGTQSSLTDVVTQRLQANPKLLQHVQTYTKGKNPYSKWTSPIRYNVYSRVQTPGFWAAAVKQFPQLVAKE